MFTTWRKMAQKVVLLAHPIHTKYLNTNQLYEEAVKELSSKLQSNTAYLRCAQMNNGINSPDKLRETEKYLLRSGVTLEQLDNLSVIHVAGTKGKGSTCAFTEAILRQYGFKTGFFSSPHLVSVRERIRINGEPISKEYFAHLFWNIYMRLDKLRESDSDMPNYFKFLTILMFHVFLKEKVDVAIIEVGIGGELDCTNIVRNPICVGVTSLGMDHTKLLGNTLEEIAYQKSGIFKPHAAAFTVLQPQSAMRVLQQRAIERRCRGLYLRVVPTIEDRDWESIFSMVGMDTDDVRRHNALLAIHMAFEWMKLRLHDKYTEIAHNKRLDVFRYEFQDDRDNLSEILSTKKIATALASCKWPGRTQILRTSKADFFLDGAHTVQSMMHCLDWFKRTSRKDSIKFLIFNTSGDRDSLELLNMLRPLVFDQVYFVPNYSGVSNIEEMTQHTEIKEQKKKCEEHCEYWGKLSVTGNNVAEVLDDIKRYARSYAINGLKLEILVTGSLHLVGALLTILDPHLTMTSKF